ncbi:hypothetical protein IV203_027920 [Nitzschia inconspicua]|uniref:Uncharacterized protein n=1 Tax=Nitzschia inconspicua TaxID=303405 RepID=A0A9K3LX89_9STRA|nr:hypothetical protein IV203_027920 [Nitzschia inconspicua]
MSAIDEQSAYTATEEQDTDELPAGTSEEHYSSCNYREDGRDDEIENGKILGRSESNVLQCTDDPVAAAAVVARAAAQVGADNAQPGRKKRLCRFPGCDKVIKSQGHCQRHGAKAKRCKVEGCDKQAQGTHEGMCKRHWRAVNFPESNTETEGDIEVLAKKTEPPPPQGVSVYENILPASIAYRPTVTPTSASAGAVSFNNGKKAAGSLTPSVGAAASGGATMPLIAHLRQGALTEPVGWHRNAERRARGMFPVTSLSTQLEPWERQLALVEILLLSGGTPNANFKDLAHAWGREKGFHQVLASSVCERRGEVERKRRSDAGKILSASERENFRKKTKNAKESSAQETTPTTGFLASGPSSVGEFVDLEGETVDVSAGSMEAADLGVHPHLES